MSGPGWYPDPSHLHHVRYFDGAAWTDQVSDRGTVSADPLPERPPLAPVRAADDIDQGSFVEVPPEEVRAQVSRTTGAASVSARTGDMLREPVLVVNQKFQLFNLKNEYSIFDAEGERIGAVRQVDPPEVFTVGLSSLRQIMRAPIEVVDRAGEPVLLLTRTGGLSRPIVTVERPGGDEVGRLMQENIIGRTRVAIIMDDQRWGSIHAEDLQNRRVSIRDHAGTEVARLTKTFAGFPKAMFVTGDNYVVQVHPSLDGPLRLLVVAAPVSILTSFRSPRPSSARGGA